MNTKIQSIQVLSYPTKIITTVAPILVESLLDIIVLNETAKSSSKTYSFVYILFPGEWFMAGQILQDKNRKQLC